MGVRGVCCCPRGPTTGDSQRAWRSVQNSYYRSDTSKRKTIAQEIYQEKAMGI